MGWTSLKISPGVVRDITRYGVSGTWFDGSMVRFRQGVPEKWAGWVEDYGGYRFNGQCRSLHRHGTLDGKMWTSAGTNSNFYMLTADDQLDVTPIATTETLALNPFATTIGSSIVTVTDSLHGRFPGDVVIFADSVGFAGLTAGDLDGEHVVVTYIDDNHYTVDVGVNASATTSGGGAAVKANYLFRAGTEDATAGGGWGSLAWGAEEWGGDPTLSLADQMGVWTHDNWGEDLVANANGGPIFYWDATNTGDRMIDILDLAGAGPYAPAEAQFIVISHRDRHLLAFGCTIWNDILVEPMTFRWCDQENIYDWDESSTTNTAGSLPLSNGSKLLCGIATAREILVWTDQALYSIQYIGPPFIYTAELLDRWSDICGLKAACSFNGIVYWMGHGGFYAYSGRTEKITCPVWDYVSGRLNMAQASKVYASSNQMHNEVIWFYPSSDGDNVEIDSYVCFDVAQNLWTFGALARTAWLDIDAISPVLAASPQPDGRFYEHENGADDGSTAPVTPINAYIESGPIELSSEGSFDKGDKFAFIRRILPDVVFRGTTQSTVPQLDIVLKMMDKPGGGVTSEEDSVVQKLTVSEGFTEENYVRLRGRSMTIRYESNTVGTNWRIGVTRIDVRTDGQK